MKQHCSSFAFHLKQATLICLFSVMAIATLAQAPLNDNCTGAILLTSNTSCNPTPGNLIASTASAASISSVVYFTTSGAGTFVTSKGVNSLKIETWGAGGAGGGASGLNTRGGGGGGGGYNVNAVFFTTFGSSYSYIVGAGGIATSGIGGNGGATSFNGAIIANGGNGAVAGTTTGPGGTGGTGSIIGGTGGVGTTTPSSGAGGAGANVGGAGGTSIFTNPGAGKAGSIYGGGGSGAIKTLVGGANQNGGNGGGGGIKVTSTYGSLTSADVWYKFVATSTNPSIQLTNISSDLAVKKPYIQLLNGTCASFFALGEDSTGILSSSGLTIGTTYYIRVSSNVNIATPTTGQYSFKICVQNITSNPAVDYAKSYINVSNKNTGGTISPGDILEIRTTVAVTGGSGVSISNVSFKDTLKASAGLRFKDSLTTRTNEGKAYQTFTNTAADTDAGWYATTGADTTINMNLGTGATNTLGGTITGASLPGYYGWSCIMMATYRVTVTGVYGTKIKFGGGALKYTYAGTNYTVNFPKDSLIVYQNFYSCSDAVSPENLIGSANNGNFGTLTAGNNAAGTQDGGPAAINSNYNYETSLTGPHDYYYSISNNTSPTNAINQIVPKTGIQKSRTWDVWDITGDHTDAANPTKGNKPCDPSQPVSATNPCGYMLVVNASYRTDKVFEYSAGGVCTDTYYEVSAWFKNLCSKCGVDVNGHENQFIGTPAYIPTDIGDSSGVRPNIAMQIDGIDYYTTGDLKYQGLGSTQTATDTLNNWVRRSFVFKTSPTQTNFKITFRNNAPGGGGNDWAVDDIGLRTCYPTMIYVPPNPIIYVGNSLTITDTVHSYFNNYTSYKWQKKPVSGSWADIVPAQTGVANPIYDPTTGLFSFNVSYTIPGTATQISNSGDQYRIQVATSPANLGNGCTYTPNTSFTIIFPNGPCAFADTNYAEAPQTGIINWNKLNWSKGHVPTCCESATITYNGNKASTDSITINITNDICIINLTLINASTQSGQVFRTVLHPGFNMYMNGNVRMGANGASSNDSCIFIAKGGGTINVIGNTVIGYPSDNATCIMGTAPGTTTYANYLLRGDSLTFNSNSFTNHKNTAITLVPTSGTVKIVNNTNATKYPSAVTFDKLIIGDATARTAICAGTNQNAFFNDNAGNLEVIANSTLIMPANYSLNAKDYTTTGAFKTDLFLRPNATLILGGISGGIAGSNFPANFTSYNLDSTSTVIFNGASQSIPGTSNNVNSFGNITLTGTGAKTASASNVVLTGNLYRTNGGHTFNANGGRVTFVSTVKGQRYYADAGTTASQFFDFTNNNTNTLGLSIDSTIGVLNELELKTGTKTTLNTGNVIMYSNASRTSHVSNLGTTVPAIVYNTNYRFIIERYLFGQKSWRFLSTPVQLNTVDATSPTVASAWREGISALTSNGYGTAITGPSGPNAELDYFTVRGSMKYYNYVTNSFIELTNTTTTKIANTFGYMLFVRGDRGAANVVTGAGTATTLRMKGQIRTGDQSFAVVGNKFQSIGNPYASQINFSSVSKAFTTNSFTVWNPALSGWYGVGAYQNYILVGSNYRLNGLATGAIRNTIESGEAFFVQSNTATNGSITVKESDKGTSSSLVSRGDNIEVSSPTIDISLFGKDLNNDLVLINGASTSFDDSFSNTIDNDDVVKLTNTGDNLFIKSNGKVLVVEKRSKLSVSDTIKLGISGMRVSGYGFQINPYLMETTELNAFLVDKFLNTKTPISLLDTTTINFDITSVAGSNASDRFMIVFDALPPTSFATITATRNSNKKVTINWEVIKERNINDYSIEQSSDSLNFVTIGNQIALSNTATNVSYNKIDNGASKDKNWYRLKVTTKGGTISYSPIVSVNEVVETNMYVFPNPVVDGKINLYSNYLPFGNYNIQISSAIGQVLKTETIKIQTNKDLHSFNLSMLPKGIYILKITNSNGVSTVLTVVSK